MLQEQDSTGKERQIVIDWSHVLNNGEDIDQMVQWVRNCPPESRVHVVLGKVKQRALGRRLQGALQALGCTVTTRQFAEVVA